MKSFIQKAVVVLIVVAYAGHGVLWAQTNGQLYFVTGLATPKHPIQVPSSVFAVDSIRQITTKVTDLVDDSKGSDFVIVDHDLRIVVIGSPNVRPTRLVIIGMDAPARVRSIPIAYEGSLIESFLFKAPERVLQALFTSSSNRRKLVGVDLRDGTAHELLWDDYRFVRTEGFWSPGDLHGYLSAFPKDGRVHIYPTFGSAELGVQLPANFTSQPGESFLLDVNNDDMIVIGRYRKDQSVGDGGVHVLAVYDKKGQTWQDVTVAGAGASVRGFGPWLAVGRAERKRPAPKGPFEVDPRIERESPGRVFRNTVVNPKGREREQTSVDGLFKEVPFYFPGELHLYNVRSRKTYTIRTDQGDSEVLLVDADTVYYRVNDTLYKAAIGNDAIEDRIKIVTDDNVPLAHWLFFGPHVAQ